MVHIREACREDVGTILYLIRELAEYEKELDKVETTEEDILRDGFGSEPKFNCLIAEKDGKPAGFAIYFFKWSTWTGRATLHLEDLFVLSTGRKDGVGTALLSRLAQIAIEKECPRFEWDVLDWNELARDFYHRIGAFHKEGWLGYRMEGQSIRALADKT